MKYLILFLIIILFHQFPNGQWIFGWAIPEVTSIAIDSQGQCLKYEGEIRDCTLADLSLILFLKSNYE